MGHHQEKACEGVGVGQMQHEVEAVLGSEEHVGVLHLLGLGLYLACAERPVVRQR